VCAFRRWPGSRSTASIRTNRCAAFGCASKIRAHTSRCAYQPLRTAIALLVMLEKQYPGKIEYAGEQVLGKHWSRTDLEAKLKSGASADQIIAEWNDGLDGFAKARARALIY
jgi:uncharacterized protein YbbC (DUF1343 family)